MSKWQAFWIGFARGFTKPWTIFTDAPDYWQKRFGCDCKDKTQCWEQCGDLGKSEEHARVAREL